MAERLHGGVIRNSSAARRIGRLGGGTQGRLKRRFLDADPGRISALCAQAIVRALCDDVGFVRLRSNVEGHVRACALRPLALGLLAAETNCRSCEFAPVDSRENSAGRALSWIVHRYGSDPDPDARFAGRPVDVFANQ